MASQKNQGTPLVIVESPAKARTIGKFLGSDYRIEASIGHIRDLPSDASEVPAELKKEKWAKLGIDVEHDFKRSTWSRPTSGPPEEAEGHGQGRQRPVPGDRRRPRRGVDLLALRAGTAAEVRDQAPRVPRDHQVSRSWRRSEHPRQIDMDLVEAQETRRIVDRLYGYTVSPLLWKKVRPRLSAGRVQSVAVRLIVERERERMRFKPAEYWSVDATFAGRTAMQRRSPRACRASGTSGWPPAATSTPTPAS
jgi:DNA topoisomerase-1